MLVKGKGQSLTMGKVEDQAQPGNIFALPLLYQGILRVGLSESRYRGITIIIGTTCRYHGNTMESYMYVVRKFRGNTYRAVPLYYHESTMYYPWYMYYH